MPGMEYIVRPFLPSSIRLPAPPEGESEFAPNVVVALAQQGSAVTFAWSSSASLTPGKTKYKEVERTTKKVRVENPDDPSQFVEVDRVKKITVANEDSAKEKLTWTFKPPAADGTSF